MYGARSSGPSALQVVAVSAAVAWRGRWAGVDAGVRPAGRGGRLAGTGAGPGDRFGVVRPGRRRDDGGPADGRAVPTERPVPRRDRPAPIRDRPVARARGREPRPPQPARPEAAVRDRRAAAGPSDRPRSVAIRS